VPRQTRAERRARRQQHTAEPAVAGAGGREASSASRTGGFEPPARPEPRREGGGLRRFLGESWGELQKVEWPTQKHVIQGTVVVLVACIIVGTYLWVADIVSKHVVQWIIG
jgi:preprotein translocase subunit SecE